MATIMVSIDERAYRALMLYGNRHGRSMEDLARCAIEEQVSRTREYDEVLPPVSHWPTL